MTIHEIRKRPNMQMQKHRNIGSSILKKKHARLAAAANDYKQLRIPQGTPDIREDALRTDTAKGNYEWWYFDSKLNDGSSLVIVFYTGREQMYFGKDRLRGWNAS